MSYNNNNLLSACVRGDISSVIAVLKKGRNVNEADFVSDLEITSRI